MNHEILKHAEQHMRETHPSISTSIFPPDSIPRISHSLTRSSREQVATLPFEVLPPFAFDSVPTCRKPLSLKSPCSLGKLLPWHMFGMHHANVLPAAGADNLRFAVSMYLDQRLGEILCRLGIVLGTLSAVILSRLSPKCEITL